MEVPLRVTSPRGTGDRPPRLPRAVAAAAVALTLAGCAEAGAAAPSAPPAIPMTGSPATATRTGHPVLQAPLTLLSGQETALRAFTGRPLMVWFVASGCGACAASLPVIARHLSAFRAAKVRILVLGLYGAFAGGEPGRAQLVRFGRGAAGDRFSDPAWTWGLASASLTAALDPAAIPDEYLLLNRSGHTVYRGSTPVSTLGPLLNHVKEL